MHAQGAVMTGYLSTFPCSLPSHGHAVSTRDIFLCNTWQ